MCDHEFNLMYFAEPPFLTHSESVGAKGLMYDIVMQSLQYCCPKIPRLNPITFETQEQMLRSISNTSAIALPVSLSDTMLIGSPAYFVPIYDSPGLILISTKPVPNVLSLQAIQSIWPLMVLILILTGYAGLLLWIAELVGRSKNGTIPKTFFAGYFESCYCAFITATTVGYGDSVPKTFFGKCFVILWIFFGIAVISAFTASMTTLLTSEQAELRELVSLPAGNRIGVIEGSLARQLVIKAGSYPVEGKNFSALHEYLHNGNVTGIVLNYYYGTFVANHATEAFEIENCHIGGVSTGFIFKSISSAGHELRECVKEHTLLRLHEHDSNLLSKLLHRPTTRKKPTELATSSIKRLVSGETLAWLSYALAALLLCIAVFELIRKLIRGTSKTSRRKSTTSQNQNKNGDENSTEA